MAIALDLTYAPYVGQIHFNEAHEVPAVSHGLQQ